MTHYKKFLRDTGIIGVIGLTKSLKELILLPILVRMLGTEGYGLWIQIATTIILFVPIVTIGLPFSLVRFLAGEKDKREILDGIWSVVSIIAGISLTLTLLLIIFSRTLANLFTTDQEIIVALGFIIFLESLNLVSLNIFRAFQWIKFYGIFYASQIVSEIILVALVVMSGYGIWGALLALISVKLFALILTALIILNRIGFTLPRFLKIKEYLAFALPTVPSNISAWVVLASDRYLIHFFLGILFVGYYAPASVIGGSLMLFIGPLAFLLPATLSKLIDEQQPQKITEYLSQSFKYFLMIAIPSVFYLSVLAKQLLMIFSNQEIAQESFFLVPIMSLGFLFFGAMVLFGQPLILQKKTNVYGTIYVAIALLNIGLNIVVIPAFGILGAASTTLLAYTAGCILMWYFGKRYLSFRVNWSVIAKNIAAATGMSLFILWLQPSGLLMTIGVIPLAFLLYLTLLLVLKGFSQNELAFLKNTIRKLYP